VRLRVAYLSGRSSRCAWKRFSSACGRLESILRGWPISSNRCIDSICECDSSPFRFFNGCWAPILLGRARACAERDTARTGVEINHQRRHAGREDAADCYSPWVAAYVSPSRIVAEIRSSAIVFGHCTPSRRDLSLHAARSFRRSSSGRILRIALASLEFAYRRHEGDYSLAPS